MKNINRPELFQGKLNHKHYFEGWYFKHVAADGGRTVAFIPGISLDEKDPHSFVQVIVSPEVKTYYFKYPIDAFQSTDDPFTVKVGESVFSMSGCHIDLKDLVAGITITGETHYTDITPIQKSRLMPNIMGFFAYIPKMECNHGVLSMTHHVNGYLNLSFGPPMDLTGGKGYIEKDWGTSFPSTYIWVQANHFEGDKDSFMCSIAKIPFGLFSFRGLIANLHFEGKEYRFATYNSAKIKKYRIDDTQVTFELVKRDVSLRCEATLSESGTLKAPKKGEMQRTIKEGLGGDITLMLKRKGEKSVTLRSSCAGIEVVK